MRSTSLGEVCPELKDKTPAGGIHRNINNPAAPPTWYKIKLKMKKVTEKKSTPRTSFANFAKNTIPARQQKMLKGGGVIVEEEIGG